MFSRLPARARFKGFGAAIRRSALYWLPLGVLVVAAFARLALPDVLGRLSLIWLDLYQRAASDLPLRIVAIDDQSLNQIGNGRGRAASSLSWSTKCTTPGPRSSCSISCSPNPTGPRRSL
jgi:CHASE2 domain-containing sensor protein